jgi:hypothetical protein
MAWLRVKTVSKNPKGKKQCIFSKRSEEESGVGKYVEA